MNTHERPQSDVTSTKASWEERGTSEAPAACIETPSGKQHQALQRKLNQRPAVQSLLQRQQDVSQSPRVAAHKARAGALQARHAAPAGSGPVVQRFTVEDGYRVSEHRTLAVEDQPESKNFYATPAEINRSNLILEAIQSRVELQAGQAAPEPLAGMQAVTPAPRNPDRPVFDVNECIDVADRVTGSNQTDAIYQPIGGAATLRRTNPYPTNVEELNVIARHLADHPDVTPQGIIQDQETISEFDEDGARLQFTFGGVPVDTDDWREASAELAHVIPSANLRAALLRGFISDHEQQPTVQQRRAEMLGPFLDQHHPQEDDARTVGDWRALLKQHFDATLRQERNEATARYMEQAAEETDARSQRVGVNAHARPETGESYAIVGSRDRAAEDGQLWSFHFAAVVARDGADSVTLENYNRNGADGANEQWYFDMQGPEGQSFHEKHRDTVAGALTLRMGAPATEELRAQIIEGLPQPVPEEVLARITQARTRAELAAIRADVMSAPPAQDVGTV